VPKPDTNEMLASKDRVIGELYYRTRGLEEMCQNLTRERDALAAELEAIKTKKE
jgi:hypothetical protein